MKKIISLTKKIFEFIKPCKSYYSCEWLEHGLIFDSGNILRVCCFQSNRGGGRPVLLSNFNGENINFEQIISKKNAMRISHRNGHIIAECDGCPNLVRKKWDSKKNIKKLLLTHWIDCNSNCVYCPAVSDEELKRQTVQYNIVPILSKMLESKLINKDTFVDISGGEASIHIEFTQLMELLFVNKFKNIVINSSGIKLSESILKGLRLGVLKLIVSLDSGVETTHQNIKQVKSFDMIVENLKKYLSASKHKDSVITKFIILPNYNDNENELDSWLLLNKKIGIKNIFIDVEIAFYRDNCCNIPDKIKDLILYAAAKAKDLGLKLVFIDRALMIYNEMKASGAKNV